MNENTNPGTYADKLMNEATRAKAMREKLRIGKAETKESAAEKKMKAKLREQGRREAYKNAKASKNAGVKKSTAVKSTAVSDVIRHQVSNTDEEGNAAADVADAEVRAAKAGIRHVSDKLKQDEERKAFYSGKLHESRQSERIKQADAVKKGQTVKAADAHRKQKDLMKKEIQANAMRRRAKEEANSIGSLTKRFTDKAEDLVGRMAEAVAEFLEEHPLILIISLVVFIAVMLICGLLGSCGAMAGGTTDTVITTSFTAENEDIRAVENDYRDLEDGLQDTIDDIETAYPGYDEYNYYLDDIGHDPFELAALLTVLYEAYTEAEVQEMLKTIYELVYTLSIEEVVEIRTRTETKWHWVKYVDSTGKPYWQYESYEVEVEYEYYILNVTLTNNGMDAVIDALGLTEDQRLRYRILIETHGNRPDVFD